MALSNILREPRRELIESVIGILALGAYLSVDYFVCTVLDPYHYEKYGPPWIAEIIFLMMILAVLVPIVLMGFFYLTHWMGETVCEWLDVVNIDPRPHRRY